MSSIKDFIPAYPSIGDREFESDIYKLKEFNELRLKPTEDVPDEPGTPLLHQELQARYFSENTPYDRGIIWHGLGTGKTCTASLIVERFKNIPNQKPALIVVKNAHLRESFRNEISSVCTSGVYSAKLSSEERKKLERGKAVEMTEETKRRRLNASIAETYEIVTIGEIFGKGKLPNDTIIKRDYSNRVIIIDEAHSIRLQPNKVENAKYKAVHHFLHTVENCTILLLTATPIWDKVYDFASLANLILPLNEQLPTLKYFTKEYFDRKGNIKPDKEKDLSKKLSGKISYLRPLISSAKRTEVGVKSPWLQWLTVYPSMLSNFQTTFASQAKESLSEDKGDAFLSNARDAATCVYPEIDRTGKVIGGSYGTKAFSNNAITQKMKWIVKKGKQGKPTVREKVTYEHYEFSNPHFKKLFGPTGRPDPYSNLRRYSTKFATIIEMLTDPARLNEKVFIYNDSVKGTGGAISLALIMQLYGFNWIRTPSAIPKTERQVTVKSPGSFVVITSDDQTISEPAQIRKTLAEYNKKDNIYGSRLRIIIGSQTISLGHTLKATRQGHVVGPHWNIPSIDQAMGRIYRAGSFDQLPPEERYVKFYRHVAVDAGNEDEPDTTIQLPEGLSSPSGGIFSTEQSVDTHIYSIAETKEHMNSEIYRIAKKASWDCPITYSRNVLANDVEGTRDCDFGECNYACDNYPRKTIDKTLGPQFLESSQGKIWQYEIPNDNIVTSNFNLLYSKKIVYSYISEIIKIFRSYFALRFDVLVELVKTTSEEKPLLLQALEKIINRKIVLTDKFGFSCYLKEEGNLYFLDKSAYSWTAYPASIYSAFPLVSERSTLEETTEIIQLQEDKSRIKLFAKNPTVEKIHEMGYKTKIVLLEQIVKLKQSYDKLDEQQRRVVDVVWDTLGFEVYEMHDGALVHNMYNSKYTGAGYNVFTKDLKPNGKMRVFYADANEWDYADSKTEKDYIEEVKLIVDQKIKEGLEDNPYQIYGAIDKVRKFKIMDNREGKSKTGRVCKTSPIADLWDMFYHLRHLPYDDEILPSTMNKSKKDLLRAIRAGKPDWKKSRYVENIEEQPKDKIRRIYAMLLMSKDSLCNSLERWFKGDNADNTSYYLEL